MNRGRYSKDEHSARKVHREVRKGLRENDQLFKEKEPLCSNTADPEKRIRLHPKKLTRKDRSMLAELQHQIKTKKSHLAGGKQSKRTTPGKNIEGQNASPKVVQTEGRRWAKTVVKQSILRAKRLSRRLSRAFTR